jgi:hypothetical protein
MSALQKLTEATNTKPPPFSLLIPMAQRTLRAIGSLLQLVIAESPPSHFPEDLLNTLVVSTFHVIATVLPLLYAKMKGKPKTPSSTLDAFLGTLAMEIFLPSIRSFAPLSLSTISNVFAAPQECSPKDVRADLLNLLKECMSALGVSTAIQPLRERLALEAVRQIEGLYPDASITPPNALESSRQERIKLLANKDSLLYLCRILHLMFVHPHWTSNSKDKNFSGAKDDLLKDAIIKSLTGLLRRRCRRPENGGDVIAEQASTGPNSAGIPIGVRCDEEVVDEVARGMILGVAERVWLFGSVQVMTFVLTVFADLCSADNSEVDEQLQRSL